MNILLCSKRSSLSHALDPWGHERAFVFIILCAIGACFCLNSVWSCAKLNLFFQVTFSVETWFVNMPLKFYYFNASQPSRAVLMTLKALELDFEEKNVNLLKGEQKAPEYLKVNSRGKVPAMTDGNLALHERYGSKPGY